MSKEYTNVFLDSYSFLADGNGDKIKIQIIWYHFSQNMFLISFKMTDRK